MVFFLGTHRPGWVEHAGVRLFVSRSELRKRKRFPRAVHPWALDSGGFTEIDRSGRWVLTAAEYAEFVRRCAEEIGMLEWAAPQDWMCEPHMLERTGLTVYHHQELTVENFVRLRQLLGGLVIPVLQGWTLDEYLACWDEYAEAGVDLEAERLVGVGTVCRRQDTTQAAKIMRRLAAEGLRLHGFGVKVTGLESYWDAMVSCDSMAWSLAARWDANHGIPSCDPSRRRSCSNCLHYALDWLHRTVDPLTDPPNQPLWKETMCAT